ncbi:hypothetical protein M569_03302, partial [Genlisea aurea]
KAKMKRTCCSYLTENNRIQNANSLDVLLESFLDFSDSSEVAFDLAFDRIIESRICDAEKDDVIERVIRLGSALTEVAKRSARRRASMHNASSWALPADLTIKIFSILDTQSVCYAAATCSFFHKCAADPLCYSNIELVSSVPKFNNLIVSTMVQRAGKALRSLKLGFLPYAHLRQTSSQLLVYHRNRSSHSSGFSLNEIRPRPGKDSCILSRSCLTPLASIDGCDPGALLRRLHLYNIERIDNIALDAALSACPSLLDLEIVGLHVELRQTLESVSSCCPLLERLFFDSSKTGRDDTLKLPACHDLVKNCPNMCSLALRGFKLPDLKLRVLIKGFHKLKYIDFSTSYSISGDFLKNLGGSAGGSLLEVMILRDCIHLREAEVSRLLSSILGGRFKHLRRLDVSNREGLASDNDWYRRIYSPSFTSLAEVLEERPNLQVVAEFPADEGSFTEDLTVSSSSETSSGSITASSMSLESSYSSDQS